MTDPIESSTDPVVEEGTTTPTHVRMKHPDASVRSTVTTEGPDETGGFMVAIDKVEEAQSHGFVLAHVDEPAGAAGAGDEPSMAQARAAVEQAQRVAAEAVKIAKEAEDESNRLRKELADAREVLAAYDEKMAATDAARVAAESARAVAEVARGEAEAARDVAVQEAAEAKQALADAAQPADDSDGAGATARRKPKAP